MDTVGQDRIPPGVCPACQKHIARKQLLKVSTEFKCPHCQRLVRTSWRFRALLFISCYGIPTVIVFAKGGSILVGMVSWLVYAFLFALVFIAVVPAIRLPHLELYQRKEDDFQSLNLRQ